MTKYAIYYDTLAGVVEHIFFDDMQTAVKIALKKGNYFLLYAEYSEGREPVYIEYLDELTTYYEGRC